MLESELFMDCTPGVMYLFIGPPFTGKSLEAYHFSKRWCEAMGPGFNAHVLNVDNPGPWLNPWKDRMEIRQITPTSEVVYGETMNWLERFTLKNLEWYAEPQKYQKQILEFRRDTKLGVVIIDSLSALSELLTSSYANHGAQQGGTQLKVAPQPIQKVGGKEYKLDGMSEMVVGAMNTAISKILSFMAMIPAPVIVTAHNQEGVYDDKNPEFNGANTIKLFAGTKLPLTLKGKFQNCIHFALEPSVNGGYALYVRPRLVNGKMMISNLRGNPGLPGVESSEKSFLARVPNDSVLFDYVRHTMTKEEKQNG